MQRASQPSQARPAIAYLTDSSGILVDGTLGEALRKQSIFRRQTSVHLLLTCPFDDVDDVGMLESQPLKHACPTPDPSLHFKRQCIQQAGSLGSSYEQTASQLEIQEPSDPGYGTCMLSSVGDAPPDERPTLVKNVCYGMVSSS